MTVSEFNDTYSNLLLQVEAGVGVSHVRSSHPHLYQALVEATAFLPPSSTIRERIWNTRNAAPPKCFKCKTAKSRWDNRNHRYSTYCSIECSSSCSTLAAKRASTHRKNMATDEYATQFKQKMSATSSRKTDSQKAFILEKRRKTMMDRYGVHHALQIPGKTDIVQTKIDKMQSAQKRLRTIEKRYGVGTRDPRHRNNRDSYEVLNDPARLMELYTQFETQKRVADHLGVSQRTISNYMKKHKFDVKMRRAFSVKCILWLDGLTNETTYIHHAGNGGEYTLPGTLFKVDGYCAETNTVYEFYGDYWHGNPNVYERTVMNHTSGKSMGDLYDSTMRRETKIRDLGYTVISIWESDYDNENKRE